MSAAELAAELAATAERLRAALLADGTSMDEMAAALVGIGDAGQYLAGALRVIADAAHTQHKDTGGPAWETAAEEAYTAADDLVNGGLYVEEHVVGVFTDALLVDGVGAELSEGAR
jgi:hypothetical protein